MKKITDLWPNEAIHCSTEAEAIAICRLMHEAWLRRSDWEIYLGNTEYDDYKKETCYMPIDGTHISIANANRYRFTIYPASDFLEEELKEGDIVYVSNESIEHAKERRLKRIFLHKDYSGQYVCVNTWCENYYQKGASYLACAYKYAVKKSDIKKERKLMMTDAERERFQKDNNL